MARRVYSEPGDRIVSTAPVAVNRYRGWTRLNHWITAASLILLALSGFALFHPSLYWLTGLFGGGQTTRWIHPFIGVVLVASFLLLFLQLVKYNIMRREDLVWARHFRDVVSGHEDRLPELGKYNAGQKFVFWGMSALIIVLIVTGVMIWQQVAGHLVSVPLRRIAVLVHALSAVAIILVFIMHVYAAIWTRGTLRAMTRGTVTGGWAWRHHRKWLREIASRDNKGPAE